MSDKHPEKRFYNLSPEGRARIMAGVEKRLAAKPPRTEPTPLSPEGRQKRRIIRVKDRERLRELIKAESLIEMLANVAHGVLKNVDAAQVTAARALLSKVLPDLASVEATVDPELFEVGTEPMTTAEWAEKHGATVETVRHTGTVQ